METEGNDNIKSKLTQKLYTENVWHVNITKPNIFPIATNVTCVVVFISVKLYCFARPCVPKLAAKSVVPELNTKDREHC